MRRVKLLNVDQYTIPPYPAHAERTGRVEIAITPLGCLCAFLVPFALCAVTAGLTWLVCVLEGLR